MRARAQPRKRLRRRRPAVSQGQRSEWVHPAAGVLGPRDICLSRIAGMPWPCTDRACAAQSDRHREHHTLQVTPALGAAARASCMEVEAAGLGTATQNARRSLRRHNGHNETLAAASDFGAPRATPLMALL